MLSNTIKKTERIKITVREEHKYADLSVEDTGIGIPKSELDRVFERFYRVDKSHSKKIGGTGLGLSIVKHGAVYHNAEIKMESVEQEGTKVTIRFPIDNETN
jgi:two-component system phosphate regulon sensor histidine kinase PhoR